MEKGKDPHAKRRLADGRNSWRKMALTEGAREEFVLWLLENGFHEVEDSLLSKRRIGRYKTFKQIDARSAAIKLLVNKALTEDVK